MSLRVVPTDPAVARDATSAVVAPERPERQGEHDAFDIVAYAKGLETDLRAAREQLRSANESVRVIRDEARGRGAVDPSRVAELESTIGRLASEARELREMLALRAGELEDALRDRAALSKSAIAIRAAYARLRDELAAANATAGLNLAEIAAARRRFEHLTGEYGALIRREIDATEAAAKSIAYEIDTIQGGRAWSLKRFVARFLGRSG